MCVQRLKHLLGARMNAIMKVAVTATEMARAKKRGSARLTGPLKKR